MSGNQRATSPSKQAPTTNPPVQRSNSLTKDKRAAFELIGNTLQGYKGSTLVHGPKPGTAPTASEAAVKETGEVPRSTLPKKTAGVSQRTTMGSSPPLVSNPAGARVADLRDGHSHRGDAARLRRKARQQKSGSYAAHLQEGRPDSGVSGNDPPTGAQYGSLPIFQDWLRYKRLGGRW